MGGMIRRFFSVAVLIGVVVVLAGAQASAQQPSSLTPEHIQRIKDNCQAADRTLEQLHASDALLRVNLGQLYDLISTKLMDPLNSRLVTNHIDASSLVSITTSYESSLNDFRTNYQLYEEQLSTTLQIDCVAQPVEFYNAVGQARELRSLVYNAVQNMGHSIDGYGRAFDTLRTNLKQTTGNQGGSSS